jgi:hypothetical protein
MSEDEAVMPEHSSARHFIDLLYVHAGHVLGAQHHT